MLGFPAALYRNGCHTPYRSVRCRIVIESFAFANRFGIFGFAQNSGYCGSQGFVCGRFRVSDFADRFVATLHVSE